MAIRNQKPIRNIKMTKDDHDVGDKDTDVASECSAYKRMDDVHVAYLSSPCFKSHSSVTSVLLCTMVRYPFLPLRDCAHFVS